MVYTEITLRNIEDEVNARSGLIKPEGIRIATVTAVVDTGSMSLVITEELRQKLGLGIKRERTAQIANGQRVTCKVTDAVEVHHLIHNFDFFPWCNDTKELSLTQSPCFIRSAGAFDFYRFSLMPP